MTVRHIRGREDWYVISVDHSEGKVASWRHQGKWLHGPKIEAHAEWNVLGKHAFGYGFQFGRNGGESDLGLSLYAGRLASLWLRLRTPWTKWARVSQEKDPKGWYNARHTSLVLFPHQGSLVRAEWDNQEHGYGKREWSLTVWKILGRTTSDTETTDTGTALIPLPEGNYEATWEAQTYTNRYVGRLGILRDRILGPRRHSSVHLKIEGGIPHEGKGENSWDCGMDGLFGCSGRTLEEAIGNAVRSTLRDRKNYGGPHNLTRPMAVTEAEQRAV